MFVVQSVSLGSSKIIRPGLHFKSTFDILKENGVGSRRATQFFTKEEDGEGEKREESTKVDYHRGSKGPKRHDDGSAAANNKASTTAFALAAVALLPMLSTLV